MPPLYQQVTDWFREKHDLLLCILPQETKELELFWLHHIYKIDRDDIFAAGIIKFGFDFGSFYEAYNEAITEAIKLI